MFLGLMEGDTRAAPNASFISRYNNDGKQHSTIKTLLKNFILPDTDMAIKHNHNEKPVYTVPVNLSPPKITERTKSINDAKLAFLNSTVNYDSNQRPNPQKEESTIHYAQIAIATGSDDTRSTGGGKEKKQIIHLPINQTKPKPYTSPVNIPSTPKKKIENHQRKVSFKTKSASASYRRPPIATKTVTITSTKVSELTKKFNDLQNESREKVPIPTKLVKTIEDLASASRCSASNSSTPSSTLSSSPNIKIVLRQRRGSKRRNNRKRCSSVDSIDTLILSDNTTSKISVIRSKSDGVKTPKASKKRLKYQSSTEQSGSDTVDGSPEKTKSPEPNIEQKQLESNKVRNVIKKFECEIIAQSNTNTLKKPTDKSNSTREPVREKPKVPEKKSSLVVTKNVVVKDGIPRLKSIKPPAVEIEKKNIKINLEINKKKEPIYDRKKYKTNYIHTEKLPLSVVEIIPEDINESNNSLNASDSLNHNASEVYDKIHERSSSIEVTSPITPNDSFLWRRKSSTQIYVDPDNTESPYCFVSMTMNSVGPNEEQNVNEDESQRRLLEESQESVESSKLNQNLETRSETSEQEEVHAQGYNKDILVGFTTKTRTNDEVEEENDYEPLEPKDDNHVVVIPIKTSGTSKMNCPLPEIPKQVSMPESPKEEKENIYQCLLEMRSHPEGDDSSLHNYEICDNQLEERTRGDGDSDDGYEYCKSPIKPYCLTSSSGIQIAEDYKPFDDKNIKNYTITKSVSGASTVSYEKIGSESIYEKIPNRSPKSKDSSPTYSSRHSFISDYNGYNDNENIYDVIKHSDQTSLSHCYESIPNSPRVVKLRTNLRKQLNSQKRLSFDTVSNVSQSTMSSEQKTNSIYGQRSVISYNGQEIAFQVPSSETSASDRSDRSDDWVDVSDEEKQDEQKIIIVRERSRGRKSPISWSQKVRHQWQKSSHQKNVDQECESSDSGHVYESLEPRTPVPPVPPAPHLDSDSFDSDTDSDDNTQQYAPLPPTLPSSRLPTPPTSGQYTLTKIASAAQKKMKQIKRNLTKRYSVAMDGKPFTKSPPSQNGIYDTIKPKKTPIYANCEPKEPPVYTNINFNDPANRVENQKNGFKDELRTVTEKRLSSGDVNSPLSPQDKDKVEKPVTPTSDGKKDNGTLSRKAYFSFKSRFRRATSLAVDYNDVPSALKITNSTFYLTDSMDGDSGFSNCDNGQPPAATSSSETLGRRRGSAGRRPWAESTPCLVERPSVPPPPPPAHHTDISAVNEELKRLLPTLSRKEKAPRARTSWYADCGADTAQTSNTSWYAEAGLYPAGNVSTSSGASSGSHPASPLPHSLFTHEPLYQFYNAAKVESVCRETGDSDSDAYEAHPPPPKPLVPPTPLAPPSTLVPPAPPPARPSAMALVAPRGPARTLWCEVPEVLNSAVLSSLAPAQKRLQEAKFELLTSEASYLNSLNVLEAHFISHPAFRETHILPRADWETLFATILPVRKCSQLLMNELEKCWQESILLQGICEIVRRHAEQHFHVYVKYCENQALMVKTLQRLRDRPTFAAALKRLESHPACQSLSLHSFLMLPMQRVTRLPLLLDAVLKHLPQQDPEYQGAGHALATTNHFVSMCNEGARNTERIEEMSRLCRAIEFPPQLRDPPNLGPACGRRDRRPVRWLVRSGEMTQLIWKSDEMKLTFGKKFHKVPLYVFLFNDHLVITKKKGEESFVAVDHCPRSLLEVCASDGGAAAARHALLLTLLENHEGRTLEMLMATESETEVSRWSEALAPPGVGGGEGGAGEGEAVYAGWDCPQVCALYAYAPAQPDELPLNEGDVVNVTRKTAEGWYYGERTRDGEAGWFPGAYTAEIASPHVRARNLRQRYRLLALSGTYFGQRRKM